jgi:hypothetical protein
MTDNKDLFEICNSNPKNMPSDDVYSFFNNFMFSKDIKLLGKLLHRYNFFLKTKHLPGDIVELGVFKGSGVITFCKFLQIFIPNSNKKVIGFDLFDRENDVVSNYTNGHTMNAVYDKVTNNELTLEGCLERLKQSEIDQSKYILIKGDACVTTKKFAEENPGCRISLIYVDLDLDEPTYHSLCNLWHKLLPGGYVVFDEYEYHKFDESNGVDKFIKQFNLEYNIISTDWIAPTSYMIKKK